MTSQHETMKRINVLATATFSFLLFMVAGAFNSPEEDPDFEKLLEELVAVGGIIGGYGPTDSPEDSILWQKSRTMIYMPYEMALELLESENWLKRAYGFHALAKRHLDSLEPVSMDVFKDTAYICLYRRKEILCPGLSLGEYALMFYNAEIDAAKINARKTEVELTVEKFIKTYAKTPNNYQSLGFSEFSWSRVTGEEAVFETRHDYRFESEGKGDTLRHYFLVDEQMNVNVIEYPRSLISRSYYPKLDDWLERYGRKLDHADSVQLMLSK